jgi:hypothetical protein
MAAANENTEQNGDQWCLTDPQLKRLLQEVC